MINYTPKNGTILLCDYKGMVPPEMVKLRPVIFVTSVSKRLGIIVPLSTTEPKIKMPWHCEIRLSEDITEYFTATACWAKCDMSMAASFDRLSLPFLGKDHGRRVYKDMQISPDELFKVRTGICCAASS